MKVLLRLGVDFLNSKKAIVASRVAFTVMVALLTLHFPVQHFIGISLHWVAVLAFLPVAIVQAKLTRPSSLWFGGFLALVAISAALSLLQLPLRDVVLGLTSYLLLPVTFFLAMQRDARNRVRTVASVNIWIALVAGAAAYYQLNFDSVLFGLYAGTSYETMDLWLAPRAASFFYSPQVYAAYMVLSVVLHDAVFRRRKSFPGIVPVLMVGFGLLSGSVSVAVCVAAYYLTKIVVCGWQRRSLRTAPSAGGLLLAVLAVGCLQVAFSLAPSLQRSEQQLSPWERMASVGNEDGFAAEANSSRLEVWKGVIAGTNPLGGHGIGSASTLVDGKDRVTTESYVLSLYYEGGVVLIAAFTMLFAGLFMKGVSPEKIAFAVSAAALAVIAPVYYAWSLAILWILLFGFIEFAALRDSETPD